LIDGFKRKAHGQKHRRFQVVIAVARSGLARVAPSLRETLNQFALVSPFLHGATR